MERWAEAILCRTFIVARIFGCHTINSQRIGFCREKVDLIGLLKWIRMTLNPNGEIWIFTRNSNPLWFSNFIIIFSPCDVWCWISSNITLNADIIAGHECITIWQNYVHLNWLCSNWHNNKKNRLVCVHQKWVWWFFMEGVKCCGKLITIESSKLMERNVCPEKMLIYLCILYLPDGSTSTGGGVGL